MCYRYTAALELTRALSNETDYITLTAINNAMKFLDLMLRHEDQFYESFRTHARGILQNVYSEVRTPTNHKGFHMPTTAE